MPSHTRRLAMLAGGLLLALAPLTSGCATTAPKVSQEDARKATSHLDIGADHLKNGRAALALREFLAAEKLDPRNARVQYALGEAYLAQNKRQDSELHYRRSMQLAPDNQDAKLSLSVLLILEARYPEAGRLCQELLDDPTFPGPWRALANLGFAEFKQGKLADARKHLALAREYQKEYWPATLTLAQLELQEGHRLEAIGLLREVLALQPGAAVEAEANYRIAEIYISLGQREEALAHLNSAVAQTPDGAWGRRSQEYLKLIR
jgi:type IV pilus assembly protein PilF